MKALDLDRIQALFYLGLCDASLGVEEFQRRDQSYPALKKSVSKFAKSAASFQLAKALLMSQDTSPDMVKSAICFECYENLMLANCAYARYLVQATTEDGNEEYCTSNARHASGAAHHYLQVSNRCNDLDDDEIRSEIGAPSKALSGYATAIAEMWQAKACDIAQNSAHLLGRLRKARVALDGAYVDCSRLVDLEPVKRELLDHIAVLDSELFAMQGSVDSKNSGVEIERSLPFIEPHNEETFDIEDIINCTPVNSTVESLVLAYLPNGGQHAPATGRFQADLDSNSSLDYRDGIWMLQGPLEESADGQYSATSNEYPNSQTTNRDSNDTVLYLGNPLFSNDDGSSMVQVTGPTVKIIAVLTVFVLLRIVLI